MRIRYPAAAAAGLLGVLLLLGAGCGKSIQANSGSKSFEPGAKRDVTTASLRTTSPAAGATHPDAKNATTISDHRAIAVTPVM